MMGQFYLLLLIVSSFYYGESFFLVQNKVISKRFILKQTPNYLNQLQDTQKKKQSQQTQNISNQKTTTTMANNKQAWQMQPEPKTARDRASFKNKVPFSEEMYETLKTSIELLSDRIKSKSPLTRDEVTWLKNAVEVIIQDANLYGPPERPKRTETDDVEGNDLTDS